MSKSHTIQTHVIYGIPVIISIVLVIAHHIFLKKQYICLSNSGGFLGMFSMAGPFWLGISLIVLGFLFWYIYHSAKKGVITIYSYALAVIFVGGLGNFTERIWHGYVCDYWGFSVGILGQYAYNINDLIILTGLGWFLAIVGNSLYSGSEARRG